MKNKGFTMIELLAVIVILAIIALIATPVVIKTINNARVTYCRNRPKLSYSGKNPYSGNIYINKDGTVEMRLFDNKTGKCAVKTKDDKEPHLEKLSESECRLSGKTC